MSGDLQTIVNTAKATFSFETATKTGLAETPSYFAGISRTRTTPCAGTLVSKLLLKRPKSFCLHRSRTVNSAPPSGVAKVPQGPAEQAPQNARSACQSPQPPTLLIRFGFHKAALISILA